MLAISLYQTMQSSPDLLGNFGKRDNVGVISARVLDYSARVADASVVWVEIDDCMVVMKVVRVEINDEFCAIMVACCLRGKTTAGSS